MNVWATERFGTNISIVRDDVAHAGILLSEVLAINVCTIDHASQIIDRSCSFLRRNVIQNETCMPVKFTQCSS